VNFENGIPYRTLDEETGRLTLKVELWTPYPHEPDYVFDFLLESEGIDRGRVFDVEMDETNIDNDGELTFATYLVEMKEEEG
jgi:hypothetical protein